MGLDKVRVVEKTRLATEPDATRVRERGLDKVRVEESRSKATARSSGKT